MTELYRRYANYQKFFFEFDEIVTCVEVKKSECFSECLVLKAFSLNVLEMIE